MNAVSITTNELRALMGLSGTTLSDLGKSFGVSHQAIHVVVQNPSKSPKRAEQIHALLTEWSKPSGMAIVKAH